MLILDALRSTVLASVIFGLIPVGWWRIKGRKQAGFAAYFGLIRPKKNKSAGRMIVVYWLVWGVTHLPFFTQFTQPSASVYTGLGMPAILPIVIISFIQTGFFEEFLFRGFISKRLVRQFGDFGILLQAILFGSLHVLLAGNLTLLSGTIIFTTTTAGGFLLGYLAEKSFQGSILPGAFLHGLGNFIINLIQAFS